MNLPEKLRAELQKEFLFDNELLAPACLFHQLDEGRILIVLAPPIKQGIPELLITKSMRARADLIVLILPSDTSTEWFNKAFASTGNGKVTLRPIQGRVKFVNEDGAVKRVPACMIIFKNAAELARIEDQERAQVYANENIGRM
jgi:hypothetical protein